VFWHSFHAYALSPAGGYTQSVGVGIKLKLCASPRATELWMSRRRVHFVWGSGSGNKAAHPPGHPRTHPRPPPLDTRRAGGIVFLGNARQASLYVRSFYVWIWVLGDGLTLRLHFNNWLCALIQRTCMHLQRDTILCYATKLCDERQVFCALISGVRKNVSCLHRCELEFCVLRALFICGGEVIIQIWLPLY